MQKQIQTDPPSSEPLFERKHLLLIVFFLATALLLFLCYLLASPFLAAFAWALALAIVMHPFHRWLERKISKPAIAAGLAVFIAALVLIIPFSLVGGTLVQQASTTWESVTSGKAQAQVKAVIQRTPVLARIWSKIGPQSASPETINQVTTSAGALTGKWLGQSLSGTLNLVIGFFIMFYFLRDKAQVMQFLRSILPLSETEATEVFSRVQDTVYASLYGTLAVAAVQGALGGLMFWWLGLPAPLLWGAIMGLLAIIPVLGAFVIWVPAAIFLAAQGNWGKALILTAWGTVVVGTIDNLLFPVLVGKRMRLHTVPVFVAIVGGLVVFGASGLVLGPVILAITDAVLELWRCRLHRRADPAEPTR